MFKINRIEIRLSGDKGRIIYKPEGTINKIEENKRGILYAIGRITLNDEMLGKDVSGEYEEISFGIELDGNIYLNGNIYCGNIVQDSIKNKCDNIETDIRRISKSSYEEKKAAYINNERLKESNDILYRYLHPDIFFNREEFLNNTDGLGFTSSFRHSIYEIIREVKRNQETENILVGSDGVFKVRSQSDMSPLDVLLPSITVSEIWRSVSNCHDFNHLDLPLVINTKDTGISVEEAAAVMKCRKIPRQIFII